MAFEKGNKYASEWTLENALPRFKDALDFAEDPKNECYSLQDAIYQSGIPYSTFYYLADNQPVLETIKKDIQQAVIRNVNKGAVKGVFAASPAIWRMKQLGEKDEQHVKSTGTIVSTNIEVADNESKEEIEKLIKKFDDES